MTISFLVTAWSESAVLLSEIGEDFLKHDIFILAQKYNLTRQYWTFYK
jgi:hypothetical protein